MEFQGLGFDDFGDIPGNFKDSTKDFGLETLDAFDVGLLSTTP